MFSLLLSVQWLSHACRSALPQLCTGFSAPTQTNGICKPIIISLRTKVSHHFLGMSCFNRNGYATNTKNNQRYQDTENLIQDTLLSLAQEIFQLYSRRPFPLFQVNQCLHSSPLSFAQIAATGYAVPIETIGTDVIIADIRKFLKSLIEWFFRLKLIWIRAFVFQSINIPFHWCIIVRISCHAHALSHMDGFAEFYKCLWYILWALVTMENQFPFDLRLWIRCFLRCANHRNARVFSA